MIRQLSGLPRRPARTACISAIRVFEGLFQTGADASDVAASLQSPADSALPQSTPQPTPPDTQPHAAQHTPPDTQPHAAQQPGPISAPAKHPSRVHYVHVRIAPLGNRAVDTWTAFDILSFLQDPSITVSDLSVEFSILNRPLAWWVRYKSEEKASDVVKFLGRQLGTSKVKVTLQDVEEFKEVLRTTGNSAEGHTVLLESDQDLRADRIEEWLTGFRLSDTQRRVRVIDKVFIDAFGKHQPARALVTFSSPEEAIAATWKHHQQMLGAAPVRMRVLP